MLKRLLRMLGRRAEGRATTDDVSWFFPPRTVVDPEAWDTYWQNQLTHCMAAFVHLFCDYGDLVDAMHTNGLRSVLCVGNGITHEARALAWAGFDVTALDLSPFATKVASEASPPEEFLAQLVNGRPRRDTGSLAFVTGDLMDPACCPGPYDVVVDRRTLQLFPEAERPKAVAAVAGRLAARGIFFSHAHQGGWRPGQPRVHALDSWFSAEGWTLQRLDEPLEGRVASLFVTTG